MSVVQPPGSGNVAGPGSSTANAVARYNGTNGQALKSTGVTVDDSNNVAGIAALTIGGSITGLTSAAASGKIRNSTVTALATSGTISVDPTLGEVFTCTPSNACTFNAASAAAGTQVTFVFTTSGTSSFVMTFGTSFKSTGTLATGTVTAKVFTVSFISDGTNLNETCRTGAM